MMDGKWDMNDLFLAVYFLLVFGVPILLFSLSKSARFSIDVSSLWTHQGRMDKLAVIILGTWWLHSCSIMLWTLLKTITTTDYVTYMGWAVPIIAKMFAPNSSQPPKDNP